MYLILLISTVLIKLLNVEMYFMDHIKGIKYAEYYDQCNCL